jgi:pilus assembly protein Flp/PilA
MCAVRFRPSRLPAGGCPEEVTDTAVLLLTGIIPRPCRWRSAREDDTQENGQGLVEYALILALIAIVAIVALIFMGSQVSNKLSVIGDAIDSVT